VRILLKLVLDTPPDAAWRAIRSPSVFTAVSRPFTTFESLEPTGFPEIWSVGDHPVSVKAFGLVPIGEQVISIAIPKKQDGVRTVVDAGHGESGALTLVTKWHHTMAVSAAPLGKTLYRDRLEFSAGLFTPIMWVAYWAFWQWRALRLRQLAPHWRA
jgi:hypothetical protein